VGAQGCRDVFVGLAGMHDDGLAGFGGQGKLGLQRHPLRVPGSVVVVVVESGLAGGHDMRIPERLAEPRGYGVVPAAGCVRVESGGRGQLRMRTRERQGALCGFGRLSDYHHPLDPGRGGAGEHRLAVGVICRVRKVTVRIY
jgi:hypothetical protein